MNAAEKLDAAIAKLERLQASSRPWEFVLEDTTLYRTIDAQLGLLRDAAARIKADTTRTPEIHYRHQLHLADAILEVES